MSQKKSQIFLINKNFLNQTEKVKFTYNKNFQKIILIITKKK